MTFQTLEEAIRHHASCTPLHIALECRDANMTYGELWTSIQERAATWAQTKQLPVILRVSQDIDFVITYLAAHLAGRVIVPLEHDIPDERFEQICNIVSHAEIPKNVADILFTTGTTGQSKGTMISHRAIMANAENLADAQEFSPELTFVVCGPLNHIGSLSKLWPTLLVGGTICILEGMKDVNAFFDAVIRHNKVGTFLVPANIRILLHLGASRFKQLNSKFDLIETGAAPMSEADMEWLCSLLPSTRLYNTYASTETGIICTYDYNHQPCVAGCLGRPMRHSSIRISEEGTVVCMGDTLMTGYVGDEEMSRLVLHDDAVFTSDLAVIDDSGNLRLQGRMGDIINIGGYKVAPTEIEDAAMRMKEIKECICVARQNKLIGIVIELLVVWHDESPINKKMIAKHLRNILESYKIPQSIVQVDHIERTYNGKINRKFYTQK